MRKSFSVTVVSVSFVLLHLACLAAISLAFSWKLVAFCAAAHDRHDAKFFEGFSRFPELRFLDASHWLCPWLRIVRDIRPYPVSARS
jgi:hypothetical protein